MVVEPVVQIAALEHQLYCPRQCALIHVDGVWTDNAHTARGAAGHRRVDSGEIKTERRRVVVRSIPLWSEALGLSGRADAVEAWSDGRVVPVEYKMGTRHGQAADVQLCAQAMCLEEMMGVGVPIGYLWFAHPRRRQRVNLDHDLRLLTLRIIEAVRQNLEREVLPAAPNDARCQECQLHAHCLPDVVSAGAKLDRYLTTHLFRCDS